MTPWGYEVEIRIPLKSTGGDFSAASQTWGINVVRVIQRSGHQDTWTQARTGSASFLLQSGHLDGLDALNSEHVLDFVPTLTSRVSGAPGTTGGWDYTAGNPQVGATAKYGITSNLTLVATVHPDFSQVESDVTRFTFDLHARRSHIPRSGRSSLSKGSTSSMHRVASSTRATSSSPSLRRR